MSNLREDAHKRWLEALLSRLRNLRVGDIYPLDPVERELLLTEIDRLREFEKELSEVYSAALDSTD